MSKMVEKNSCSDFSGHFGVPPGLQFSPKFEYFWPKTRVIMWWFTPFLNWADILTVERAVVVLVKLGGNRDDSQETRWDTPSRCPGGKQSNNKVVPKIEF